MAHHASLTHDETAHANQTCGSSSDDGYDGPLDDDVSGNVESATGIL